MHMTGLDMRVRFLFLIIGIINVPMVAQAQGDDQYRVKLFGGLGFSRLSDGERILGNGPGVSASAAYSVRPNTSLGVDLNRSDHSGVLPHCRISVRPEFRFFATPSQMNSGSSLVKLKGLRR
jgi:hypothetical protein